MPTHVAPRRGRTGDARDRAVDVLVRVEADGAFAAPVLSAALDRAPALAGHDRALATELVYGVLRTAPALDARLARHVPRAGSFAKLEPYARAVLRVAAYQILALGRVPPRAAVNAAVEALKRGRSAGFAGFANAVLRRLADERPAELPPDARAALALAAVPDAVLARVAEVVGGADAARALFAAALSEVPPAGVRANLARATRDALAARLAAELGEGAEVLPGAASPLALRVRGGGALARTRAYAEGLFALQEEGAQCVALAAEVAPGMRVLDACAGRGGKTTLLAAALAGRGVLHATDVHPDKLAQIAPELARLGLAAPDGGLEFATAAADLTRGLGTLAPRVPREGYDVVVVDAPCSGLGTLARRPDILAHRAGGPGATAGGDARATLPELQRAILARAAPLVRPGGVLLYAVCTLTRAEGDDVVAALRAEHPAFVPAEGGAGVPDVVRAPACVLRPDVHGTDGFMVFRLRRAPGA